MHSFLFPEDLDPLPHRTIEQQPASPKKIQEVAPMKRSRPVPIILPPTFSYNEYKPKDEVVVSVTRLSLDERSPILQKFKEKRPNLMRWKSATLSKQDKEDRQVRMALAEAERAAHATARVDSGLRSPRGLYMSALEEEHSDEPIDYGVHHVMF